MNKQMIKMILNMVPEKQREDVLNNIEQAAKEAARKQQETHPGKQVSGLLYESKGQVVFAWAFLNDENTVEHIETPVSLKPLIREMINKL